MIANYDVSSQCKSALTYAVCVTELRICAPGLVPRPIAKKMGSFWLLLKLQILHCGLYISVRQTQVKIYLSFI